MHGDSLFLAHTHRQTLHSKKKAQSNTHKHTKEKQIHTQVSELRLVLDEEHHLHGFPTLHQLKCLINLNLCETESMSDQWQKINAA